MQIVFNDNDASKVEVIPDFDSYRSLRRIDRVIPWIIARHQLGKVAWSSLQFPCLSSRLVEDTINPRLVRERGRKFN